MIISFIIGTIFTILLSLFVYFIIRFLECDLNQFPIFKKIPGYGILDKSCTDTTKKQQTQNLINFSEQQLFKTNEMDLMSYIKAAILKNTQYKKEVLENIVNNIDLIISGKEELLYSQIKKPEVIRYDRNKLYLTELSKNTLEKNKKIKINLGNLEDNESKKIEIEIDFTNYYSKIIELNAIIAKVIKYSTYLSLGEQKLSIYYNNPSAFIINDPTTSNQITQTNSGTQGGTHYSLKSLLKDNTVGKNFKILNNTYVFVKNIIEAILVPENWKNNNSLKQDFGNYPYPLEIANNIYNFPENENNGEGQIIGIVTYGKWFYHANEVDINFKYLISQYKEAIPELNEDIEISVNAIGAYDPTISMSDEESMKRLKGAANEGLLDLGIILSCCPKIKKVYIICMSNESVDEKELIQFSHNNNIPVLSISWGSDAPRNDDVDRYLNYNNNNYYRNITICVSSGDHGGLGNDQEKPNNTLDPASSKYVLACGGTQNSLIENMKEKLIGPNYINNVYNQNQVWVGSGGGISNVSLPDYQLTYFNYLKQNKNIKYDYLSKPNRIVPDIAGMGQSNWFIPVQFNDPNDHTNLFSLHGGTSAVAPLYASLFVVINQERKEKNMPVIGFVNETLYNLAKTSYQTYFKGITDGITKGGHKGEAYYNMATGIGELRFDKFIEYATNPANY